MRAYLTIFGDESVFGNWEDIHYEWAPETTAREWCDAEAASTGRVRRVASAVVPEQVNLDALREYFDCGTDRRAGQLAAYIQKVGTYGEIGPNGLRAIQQTYYKLGGVGRAFAGSLSLQSITREARRAALRGLGALEWDLKNAQPSIFLRCMVDTLGSDEASRRFPLWAKFCSAPEKWRERVSQFYAIPLPEAKILFLRIMFGGSPSPVPQGGSLPVIEEPQWGFKMAQGILAERNVL